MVIVVYLVWPKELILQEIKSVLGFGRVSFDSSVNAYRYRVSTKKWYSQVSYFI